MKQTLLLLLVLGTCTAVPASLRPGGRAAADREAFFTAKVAPVLRERCVECHNAKKARAGLDLTARDPALAGGDKGPAVVPGSAEKSLLLRMVSGAAPKMPRDRDPLTPEQIAHIRKWVEDGAAWPEGVVLAASGPGSPKEDAWWSLRPLRRPQVPTVKDAGWVRNPIDAFILKELEGKALTHSLAADRATYIRRVTYDLHGLPPAPEEIDAFVADTSPDAFERLVDRLLASPRYAERWARHWLDVIHYADTHGYDKDKRRPWAWLFRDWVIRAFQQDLPYRRFVRYQLAGDAIDPDDPDGIIATGFVVAGPWDFVGHIELREGTVEKEKTRVIDRDDMVANAMSTFVSMTAHCARCHDHKFDPIPTKDYYRLQAVFAGVERGNRTCATAEARQQRAALEKQREALAVREAELGRKMKSLRTPELERLERAAADGRAALAKLPLPKADGASPTNGYHSAISPARDAEKWVQVDLGAKIPIDAIRIVPARPTDFRDSPGFGFPLRFKVAVADDPTFAKAETVADHTAADYPNPGNDPYLIRLGGKTARYVRVTATRLWERTRDYVFALAEIEVDAVGKNVARGAKVTALDSIEAGRWARKNLVDGFDSRKPLPDVADAALRQRDEVQYKLQQTEQARRALAESLIDPATRAAVAEADRLLGETERQIKALAAGSQVYAAVPIAPRPIHVLHRGDVERKGERVNPGTLSLVPGLPSEFKLDRPDHEGTRRLALADWITDGNNVLTWRSIVNRVWQYHFGRGIVDTPNDFGRMGSRPSHPELLDWLAVEFRDGGQSFKRLHRLIVLSSTYRQASAHDEARAKVDADNRLLWRTNRRRLDAESIRDGVLSVSGKLDLKMYGPGFDLFRFKDDHSPVYDHSALEKIHDPATYRRTVYRFTVRSVPNPFLDCLDCADPNISVPVRNTTLTALQALALLNNPFVMKQAEFFAGRLERLTPDRPGQVEAAFRLAFGRSPSAPEREALAGYARRHGLANACRVLLNANEFVFID